jgi:uncharacterized protein (TIGR02996 family)
MSAEPALLAAVAAAPDDDLPRLVYADWLDENGRPLRAEFIRLQIEIARKETLPRAAVNAFSHLWKRQQEILDDHRDELLGPLAGVVEMPYVEFRRGFLFRVGVEGVVFIQTRDYLSSLLPRPEVRIELTVFPMERLLNESHAELITELCVSHERFENDALFTGLSPLDEVTVIGERCPHLRVLELEARSLGDGVGERFSAPFPALVELDLSFNDLTDAGVIALLNTGVPQRLKRLVLGGNPIGDQAAMELADRLGGSTVLENLNLRMTNIGQPGRAALLARLGGRVDLF